MWYAAIWVGTRAAHDASRTRRELERENMKLELENKVKVRAIKCNVASQGYNISWTNTGNRKELLLTWIKIIISCEWSQPDSILIGWNDVISNSKPQTLLFLFCLAASASAASFWGLFIASSEAWCAKPKTILLPSHFMKTPFNDNTSSSEQKWLGEGACQDHYFYFLLPSLQYIPKKVNYIQEQKRVCDCFSRFEEI